MSKCVLQHGVEEIFLVLKERMVSALCLCIQKGILYSGLLVVHGQKNRYCDI